MLYSEKVMDHFMNPRNVGVIEDADGIGEVGNAKCGDIMKIYLKVDNDIITDVKFETFGCGSAIVPCWRRRPSRLPSRTTTTRTISSMIRRFSGNRRMRKRKSCAVPCDFERALRNEVLFFDAALRG